MDPLSITASLITVLGTGGAVTKGLGMILNLKNAPNILLQLNNEVSDLTLVIRAVDDLCRRSQLTHAAPTQEEVVYSALERARNVVLDLEKLIEYTLTKQTSSGSHVNRIAWLASLDRIKKTRTAIRAIRNDLATV